MKFREGTIIVERGARMRAPRYVVGVQRLDEYGDLCYDIRLLDGDKVKDQGSWYSGFTEANFIKDPEAK